MLTAEKKYYPQLDSIRAFAFLSVFFYHTLHPSKGNTFVSNFFYLIWSNLHLGLDVFFVLSSFLLTFLGIKEFRKKGEFSIKNFYLRRILRIWPLYYLILFFSFVVLNYVKEKYAISITLPDASWYIFFISNFYDKPHVFYLKMLWTLSVEEQFYILWGICLLYFQKSILKVILVLFILSLLFNFISWYNNAQTYTNTFTYLLDMMVGAYAAYVLLNPNKIIRIILRVKGNWEKLFYTFLPICFVIYFLLVNNVELNFESLLDEIFRVLFVIYCGALILHQMLNDTPFFNLKSNKFLIYTGKISYGLYCYHGIVITFTNILLIKIGIHYNPFLVSILILALTYLIASLSYKFLEKPFLKLKIKIE